ncbi:hypothetical protein LCGC14_0335100 [marine sediment metagenome]|uniref:Uncharacterized protein n=1 Tax=marine sediment metagenome TaxID=412755 RepID=A0A0F9TYF8_9ZZZZ
MTDVQMKDVHKASDDQWRGEDSDDWDLPSRAVVACDGNGTGAVLWTVGPHLAFEIQECGFVDLADLGLDGAPLGVSIWEGFYTIEGVRPNDPEDNDSASVPNGEFRAPTDQEWEAIKAGRRPWEGQK